MAIREVHKAPKEKRVALLKQFKEKLTYQKEGLAKIQEELIKTIRVNPDATYAQLFDQAKQLGVQYGLSWWQEEIVRRFIRKYEGKHKIVQKIKKEYPNDNNLFEAVFGRQPKGRIEAIEGPMNLFFRVENPEDYAFLYSHAFLTKREPTSEEINQSQKTGGCLIRPSRIPGLESAVIVEMVIPRDTDTISKIIRAHEEQHIITDLFKEEYDKLTGGYPINEAYNAIVAGEIKDLEENLRRYFINSRRVSVEEEIKGEIFSFSKHGWPPQETVKYLTENDLYGYLSKTDERLSADILGLVGEENEPIVKKIAAEVFDRKKYNQKVKEAVEIFDALRKKGYSLEQVIALLQPEPLFKWKKTYKRLTGKEFKSK